MNDTPVLKTPGEMIAEARESRELTIAQLAERTKIPPNVLTALEMDEYHKISGPLYIKSFLRTCAVDLGLDPDDVLGLYNKISGERGTGSPGAETVWGEEEVQVSRIGLPWFRITLAVGVVAVSVGLGLFALRGCGDDGPEQARQDDPVVQESAPGEPDDRTVVTDSTEGPRSNSLMAAETEADLREMAEDTVPPAVMTESTTPDTVRAEPAAVAEEIPPPASELPEGFFEELAAGARAVRDSVAREQAAAAALEAERRAVETAREEETAPAPVEDRVAEPEPLQDTVVVDGESVADGEDFLAPLTFMESSWPLVLNITCEKPQNIRVKRDGDREFGTVRWPAAGQDAPAVPEAGFVAGLAYGYHDNLVVLWGAEDHFSIILERVRGVQVAINGNVHDISRLKPGQELILDAFVAGAGR